MLEQTLELMRWQGGDGALIADHLGRVLGGTPLDKPADHRSVPATDLFPLHLTLGEARQVLATVERAEREGFRTSGTIERGLGGFRAAWQEYCQWLQAADQSLSESEQQEVSMSTASARVLAMIQGWNDRDIDAILACFAEDAIYHNMPMEPVQGKDDIRAAINGFVAGASAIRWDMIQIAENASGVVLTERLDKFQMGDQWIEVPVMGAFEVRDDRIVAWRDYFDLAGFQAQIE